MIFPFQDNKSTVRKIIPVSTIPEPIRQPKNFKISGIVVFADQSQLLKTNGLFVTNATNTATTQAIALLRAADSSARL